MSPYRKKAKTKPTSPKPSQVNKPTQANHPQDPTIQDGPTLQSLSDLLRSATSDAAARSSSAFQVYSKVATCLDDIFKESTTLAPHMKAALEAFCDDISYVATRHYEVYITGSSTDRGASTSTSTFTAPPPKPAPPAEPAPPVVQAELPTTYAQAAAKPAVSPLPAALSRTQHAQSKKPLDRLFVRLLPSHSARKHSGYTLQTALRASLGLEPCEF